jgi:hypothetical protein
MKMNTCRGAAATQISACHGNLWHWLLNLTFMVKNTCRGTAACCGISRNLIHRMFAPQTFGIGLVASHSLALASQLQLHNAEYLRG